MTHSFTKPGWSVRFFLWAMAVLMALTPIFVPIQALAAVSSTFDFVSVAANVVPDQAVSLLNFAISESDGGATLNSLKLGLYGGVPGATASDVPLCFMIQDTNNPSADVFDSAAGDNYWRWNCGAPNGTNAGATLFDLATDLDIDSAGPDSTSTPGIAALPTSMTGRGTYEFTFGVIVGSSATNGNQFRLIRWQDANGTFAVTGNNLQISGAATASAYMTIVNDITPPTITGGGPGNGQQFVPDQAFIDAVASEALASATVNTTNVKLHSCTGATDASSCATPVTTTNLCTSVSLNSTQIVCNHAALTASTTYRFQVGTGITDAASNPLATATTRIFRTSSTVAGTNTTAPRVMQSVPSPGSNFPVNGNITLDFPLGPEGNMNFNTGGGGSPAVGDLNYCTSGACAFSLKKAVSLSFGAEICTDTTTCAPSWNSTTRRLTINPATNLDASSEYEMCLRGGAHALAVKNSSNQSIASDTCLRFSTIASDSTAPTLAIASPVSPTNNATNVSMFSSVKVKFSESLDQSTLSLSTIRLCADSTSGTAGCESGDTRLTDTAKFAFNYDTFDKSVRLDPLAIDSRSVNTKYCIEVIGESSGVKDLSGNAFAATSSANCFTTASSATDTVSGSPTVLFADGDNFKVVVKFSESMRSGDLISSGSVNTTNVALECPTGVTVPLTSKSATYNAETQELEISGLGLPAGQTCRVTITSASDLAGNAISTSNSNNIGNFTVLDSAVTGGFLGAGAPASDNFFGGTSGQTAATFWERPQRAEPRNKQTSKSTGVEVEFPAPGAMAVGSKIILTFPSGFNLASASLPATSVSFFNKDINGPESGVPTLTATVSGQSITLTTVGASIGANQRINFELANITTPTEAAENLRISIIAKDSSGVKIGQTINPAPFNINAGGSLSIAGTVCKGATSGGSCTGSDTAIASAKVFCAQMGGFEVGGTGGAFVGHQEATTDANGDFTISGLTSGQYNCGLPPDPTTFADTAGGSSFESVTLASSNKTGLDFRLKNLSGAADSKTLTVSITGGPASETIDAFCSAGATDFQFSAPTMKSLTLNASGVGSTTLKLQQDKSYECGVGPHIAFEQFSSGGPPPVPTFTFMPPKPQKVTMSADTTLTYALTSTNRTITGSVQDGAGSGIANVFVHAAPAGCFDATSGEVKDCFGAFAQTKTDGTFTLNVSDGVYEVGADGPGLPPSTTELANVKGANVTGVTLKMVKSSTTISGAVQDESGNGIKYAHVSADRRTLITGTDACDFTNSRPAGGFADSPTDSSGNFTIYAATGIWCLRAFSPAYGEVGTKTVNVTTASLTGQNIAATAANFGTVSGTVTKSSSAVSGAFVNCFGTTGGNHAQSGSDGTYSMKVKLATSGTTSFQCEAFAPGVGPMGQATVTIASGATTATQNFTQAGESATVTVTATGLTEGFCEARDSSGLSSGAPIQSGTATIKAPAGTYTVRCGTKNTGPLTLTPTSVTLTAGGTAAVTATVPTLRTVGGRVTDGTSNLEGAKVVFTETTTKASFVVTSGNQSGTNNNLSGTGVPEGTYNITASKKGYQAATSSVTISGGNATLASVLALTQATGSAGATVTFPIEAESVAYTGDAKVICSASGKTLVGDNDKTTSTAAVALTNGTWSCKAVGDNGKQSASSSVTVTAGSLVGSAPTFSLDNAISGFTSKSDSGTLALSSGGRLNFNDIDSGLKLDIPSGALSTTDSSTGSVSAETDATAAEVDPGTDANVVGKRAYKFKPKDSGGNQISDLNSSATLEIPYTDAEVSDAGVDETKLQIALFDDSTGTWERQSTTVDTTNNTLTAQVDHFSTYGVIGGVSSTTTSTSTGTTSSGGGGGGGGGGSPTASTPTTTAVPSTTTTETPSTTATDSGAATPADSSAAESAAPAAAPAASVAADVLVKHPTDVSSVLEALGVTRNTAEEAKYRPLLKSDASSFKVSLSADQENAVTNFVAYGISQATVKLGSGERRAVLRDYFDTVGRSDVKFTDVERITNGEKPVFRNLKKEQGQVSEALRRFEVIVGHRPNFDDAKEDLLWNTLMYRIRFTRDLEKEKKAIGQFRAKFRRLPSTPMDWAAVRGLGYVVNK